MASIDSTQVDDPDDIHSKFLGALARGAIVPGQRVGEVSLAARWGVSRLPVRDALIRLESEGLVERRKQSGTYVKETSLDEMLEIYALRSIIEGWVVRQVAGIVTEEQLQELERLAKAVDKTSPGEKIEKIVDRESRFHLRLCEIAGLRHTMRVLNLNYLFARSFQIMVQQTGGGPTTVHHDLVAALRSRDADRCEALVKNESLRQQARIKEENAKAAAPQSSKSRKVRTDISKEVRVEFP